MADRTLGHRAPLLWLVLPLMAGLASGRAAEDLAGRGLLAPALAAAVLAVAAARRAPRLWAPALAAALTLAGGASYTLHRQRLAGWDERPPREARLTLQVERVFAQTDPRKVSGLARVVAADGQFRALVRQRVAFALSLRAGDPAPLRSTVLLTSGVLAPLPRHPVPDSFEDYLDKAGVNFRLARGRALAVVRAPTCYRRFCARALLRLESLLGEGVAERQPALAAIYRAMMLGQKQQLGDEQETLFKRSGTMHLFAINGLHIGIVALTLRALLAAARCPRAVAVPLALAVVWLDVDLTGATPSALRAFLLVACHETGRLARRPPNGVASLAAAALLVLLADPMALFSASFQMSYGVVLTVLCLGLPLAETLARRWRPFDDLPQATWHAAHHAVTWSLRWLAGALGLGISALLVGAITGAAFFQLFAPIGLLVNLALVPLASLTIMAGFASVATGLGGLTRAPLLFNHAALVLLWTIDRAIHLALRLPGGWWPAHWRTTWAAPLALATLLVSVVAGYAGGWRPSRGGWWPPFVVTAVALLCGVRLG